MTGVAITNAVTKIALSHDTIKFQNADKAVYLIKWYLSTESRYSTDISTHWTMTSLQLLWYQATNTQQTLYYIIHTVLSCDIRNPKTSLTSQDTVFEIQHSNIELSLSNPYWL